MVLVINNLLNIGKSRNIPRLAIVTRYAPSCILDIDFLGKQYEAVGVNLFARKGLQRELNKDCICNHCWLLDLTSWGGLKGTLLLVYNKKERLEHLGAEPHI